MRQRKLLFTLAEAVAKVLFETRDLHLRLRTMSHFEAHMPAVTIELLIAPLPAGSLARKFDAATGYAELRVRHA